MSDIAETMRHEVAAMILAGNAEAEIYAHYKATYGEQILAVPDGVLGVAAFAIPTTISALATGALFFGLYRFHRRSIAVARVERAQAVTGAGAAPVCLSDEAKALRERVRMATEW